MGLYPGSVLSLTDAQAVAVAIVDQNGDQIAVTGALPVTFVSTPPATATLTSVPASITSVVLAAANANRKQITIVNAGTKNLFVAFAATATTGAFSFELPSQTSYVSSLNGYTGVISGIWNAANGAAKITEVTP